MSQVGCASAASTPTSAQLVGAHAAERPAGRGQDEPLDGSRRLCRAAAGSSAECSESTGITRAPVASASCITSSPPTTRLSLLASARSMPSAERRDRRPEPGRADQPVQDQVGARLGDQLRDAVLGPARTSPRSRPRRASAAACSSASATRATPWRCAWASSRSQLPSRPSGPTTSRSSLRSHHVQRLRRRSSRSSRGSRTRLAISLRTASGSGGALRAQMTRRPGHATGSPPYPPRDARSESTIGAHVDRIGVLGVAADLDADCMQIFLSDPGSWREPPPQPEADRDRAPQPDRRVRPCAVPDQRLLAEVERPLRLAQDPPADVRRRVRARRQGCIVHGGHAEDDIAEGPRTGGAVARDAPRTAPRCCSRTRPGRQRRRAALRRARAALGR